MEGLTTIESDFSPAETMERLEAGIKARGMKVFARIPHSTLAAEVGMELLPVDLLIFGNPKGGTPLMQAAQTIGIDLPLKMLVWQDAQGKTWISYNEPGWLAKRHGIDTEGARAITGTMASALNDIALGAAKAA